MAVNNTSFKVNSVAPGMSLITHTKAKLQRMKLKLGQIAGSVQYCRNYQLPIFFFFFEKIERLKFGRCCQNHGVTT